jgi:hypothetical protein
MKTIASAAERLGQIRKFSDVVRYLEEELDWPMRCAGLGMYKRKGS